MICIPYPRVNCLKTMPFTAAHTSMVYIWQYRPPGVTSNNVASVCGGLTTNDLQLINYINLLTTCLSSSLSGYFFFMCFFFQYVVINAVNLGMLEPSAQNRQAAERRQFRNKINIEETEKQQRKVT